MWKETSPENEEGCSQKGTQIIGEGETAEKQTEREFEAKKQEDELSAELICTIITVNDEPFY